MSKTAIGVMIMVFNIDDVRDISKLISVIRLMIKGKFKISGEIVDQVLTRLHRYAQENGVVIKIVSPSGERIVEFTSYGIVIGAALGFYIGQLPGALIGCVIGGVAGFWSAHVKLVMDCSDDDNDIVMSVA